MFQYTGGGTGWAGMGVGRRLWAAAGAALVLAGGAALVVAERSTPAPPHLDAALERSVLPVVDRYVLTDPRASLGGDETAGPNRAGPRGFCTERVIEIRRTGTDLRVGLVAWCGHFERTGARLTDLEDGVTAGVLTVSPASAPARVTGASWEPDDTLATWAPAHFSPAGTAEVERVLADSDANLVDPAVQARAAFGLPAHHAAQGLS